MTINDGSGILFVRVNRPLILQYPLLLYGPQGRQSEGVSR
jgi:hypothetical protein